MFGGHMRDIVYILKEDIEPDEIRYSLRSVEANFPYNRVWFVCGKPKGIEPDIWIRHKQSGSSKWDLIKSSMKQVIYDPDLTDEFYLFNDDFFVMKPFEGEFINYSQKTLTWRVAELFFGKLKETPYSRTLIKAREELKTLGYEEINFEVHLPMLINKELMQKCIDLCSSPQMRSEYGNINRVPYIDCDDVKVYDLKTVPKKNDFISTTDKSFHEGAVGRYIREMFKEPSRFERN